MDRIEHIESVLKNYRDLIDLDLEFQKQYASIELKRVEIVHFLIILVRM